MFRNKKRVRHYFSSNTTRTALFVATEITSDKQCTTGLTAELMKAKITSSVINVMHSYVQPLSFYAIFRSSIQTTATFIQITFIYINDIPSVQNDGNIYAATSADDRSVSSAGSLNIVTANFIKSNYFFSILIPGTDNQHSLTVLTSVQSYSQLVL